MSTPRAQSVSNAKVELGLANSPLNYNERKSARDVQVSCKLTVEVELVCLEKKSELRKKRKNQLCE